MNDSPAAPKLTHNEVIKQAIPTLAGNLAATLKDPNSDRFSDDDTQFLKFHGIYQQDDRDLRKTGKKYLFMVRLRLPGGVISPAQYLACDALATRHGNDTLRVTSRQSLQFHGVVKTGLGLLMRQLNEALITTLAACGDVSRNVMAPPTPATTAAAEQIRDHARQVAAALSPRTPAYHAIWVEGVQLDLEAPANKDFSDPLYGKTYLPRKFKLAFAIPPRNDVDVLTNCCGFIAILDPEGRLAGYNLTAGGGMGRSHGNEQTFPRVADVVGFLRPERVVDVAREVLTIHRDFGDRGDRKRARLKYVLAERGPAWFKGELDRRLGFPLEAPRPFQFEEQGDAFGWHEQTDGRLFLGLFVETGRIRDAGAGRLKTGLAQVIRHHEPEIRLTPGNNVVLANLDPAVRPDITRQLAAHGVSVEDQGSVLRRASMACVALPTCGLALAESERCLPSLIGRFEGVMAEVGLPNHEITIRMTGCPNGCARPYMAEIGLVGKAPGRYQIYLGGNAASTRLNRLYRESVKDADLVGELRPLLARYAHERTGRERFGDWAARALWPVPVEVK